MRRAKRAKAVKATRGKKVTRKAKKVTRKTKKAAVVRKKPASRRAGGAVAGPAGILLVNIIPKSLSSETNQDS